MGVGWGAAPGAFSPVARCRVYVHSTSRHGKKPGPTSENVVIDFLRTAELSMVYCRPTTRNSARDKRPTAQSAILPSSYSAPPPRLGERSTVMSVSVFVCPRSHLLNYTSNLHHIFCAYYLWLSRYSSSGVICYVFPVLWMTSYLQLHTS